MQGFLRLRGPWGGMDGMDEILEQFHASAAAVVAAAAGDAPSDGAVRPLPPTAPRVYVRARLGAGCLADHKSVLPVLPGLPVFLVRRFCLAFLVFLASPFLPYFLSFLFFSFLRFFLCLSSLLLLLLLFVLCL